MNISITFKHMNPNPLLKTLIEEKSIALKKYFNGKINVVWSLDAEKVNKVAHCHLLGNDMDYFGEATTKDLRTSVDLVLSKLEKQVKKHKEILKGRHKGNVGLKAA